MNLPSPTERERAQQLHRHAMDKAEEAFIAQLKGDLVLFQSATQQALEAEIAASSLIAPYLEMEPTRSVFHRSAAALALDLSEWRTAERLICTALAGNPPIEIAEELRDMMETVHFDRHFQLRGMKLSDSDARLVMAGPAVDHGFIEYREFRQRTDAAEKMFLRTAERKMKVAYREDSHIAANLQRHFGTYMGVQKAASYAIAVRVGTGQLSLPLMDEIALNADEVIEEVMECIRLVNQGEDALRERIPQDAYFRNFVALQRSLAPDGERIKTVGLTILRKGKPINVSVERPPIKEKPVIRRKRGPLLRILEGGNAPEQEEQQDYLIGILQAADKIDAGYVRIKLDNGTAVKISVPEGIMADIVKPLWDERVIVYLEEKKSRGGLVLSHAERYVEMTAREA